MEKKVFAEVEKRGHEQVSFFHIPSVGLKAIVGIHNTVLGPALGGCRMRLYEDESQALDDVLRLSEGITYKSAIAGMDLGGGKACLIVDPGLREGREELFEELGRCLNHLGGRYITAEDMGSTVEDMMVVRRISKYVVGTSPKEGGSGDPSPWTARGVFKSIIAACERRYGSKDLSGKSVAIQGVGNVGMYLLELLRGAGVDVTVCDTNKAALARAQKDFGARVCEPEKIYDVACNVYAPCAVGQTINHDTLPRLHCDIIAGGANNQLIDNSVYKPILAKGMLYCPDFVVNAGGVINVGAELVSGGYNKDWVTKKVDNIYHTVHQVLDESESRQKFPEVVAIELAKERIARAKSAKR